MVWWLARPPAGDPLVLRLAGIGGPSPPPPNPPPDRWGPGEAGPFPRRPRVVGWRCRRPRAARRSGFTALELLSRNFSAPRRAGEAAAAAPLPTLRALPAGVWRRHLPRLRRARAASPARRWPRRGAEGFLRRGAFCLWALSLGRQRSPVLGRDTSVSKIALLWRVCQLYLDSRRGCEATSPKLKIVVFSDSSQRLSSFPQ